LTGFLEGLELIGKDLDVLDFFLAMVSKKAFTSLFVD
jgi:hypothetical protein